MGHARAGSSPAFGTIIKSNSYLNKPFFEGLFVDALENHSGLSRFLRNYPETR